jgi:hypothetical protein
MMMETQENNMSKNPDTAPQNSENKPNETG